MKKILAIAVASAIAAPAMADMTISGTYAYGWSNVEYETPTVTAGVSNDTGSGFGVDTAAISVAASEDMGNGVTVAAGMTFDGITDANGVTGANSYLKLSGDFGTVSMSNVEAGSPSRAAAQVGAPVNNMEGEILGAASSNVSILGYTAPKMGNITLSGSVVSGAGDMGAGDDESSVGAKVAYAANGLTAFVDYHSWADNDSVDDRVRAAVTYTMGDVSVGYGHQNVQYSAGGEDTETTVGVKYQVSDATSIGAVYVKDADEAATTTFANQASVDRKGYSVGFSHDLSANVNLSGNYSSWETAATGANNEATKTNVVLAYSF